MPIRNYSFCFYLSFRALSDLAAFKDFLANQFKEFRVKEGVLQATGEKALPFHVYFTISGGKPNDTVPSDKFSELIKWVSDAGTFREQEMRLDYVQSVASIPEFPNFSQLEVP